MRPGRKFIDWLEAKFSELGVGKIVPDSETLEEAYRRAYETARINQAIDEAFARAHAAAETVAVPPDLVTQVTGVLERDLRQPWDDALASIVTRRLSSS